MSARDATVPGFLSLAAYRLCLFFLRLLFLPVCRVHVRHAEEAERSGPWILAPNHISHFDPPLLSLAFRRQVDWMAMAELFQNRFLGFALRTMATFPVARGRPDRTSLRTAVQRLQAGRVVGIFPEGGIRDGAASMLRNGQPRPGLSVVAGLAGAVVIPAVIFGSDRLYHKKRWWRFRSATVWIALGSPIAPPTGSSEARKQWETGFCESMRTLAEDTARHFSLGEDDWPKAPAERMKEP